MNKIDLHMHSNRSLDGEKTIQELVDIASNSNIEVIAISDHNTTKVYDDQVDNKGVNIIKAIELDCSFKDKDFHLLGYRIDPFNPIFRKIEDSVTSMEKSAGVERLKYIIDEMKIKIDMELLNKLCPNGVYEAESVCEVALMNDENINNPYLKEYYSGGKHSICPFVDFYWEYCAKGKLAYSPIQFMEMSEAIEIYRSQNAFIVLAHPGNNVKEDMQLMKDIVALGIDGLEVYSSYHSKEQIEFYKKIALENNLVMTCGSDYHGKTKPHVIMGECKMPKEEELLLRTYLNV